MNQGVLVRYIDAEWYGTRGRGVFSASGSAIDPRWNRIRLQPLSGDPCRCNPGRNAVHGVKKMNGLPTMKNSSRVLYLVLTVRG